MTVVGIGGREAADPSALLDLAAKALAEHGLTLTDVETLATIEARANHPGIQLLAVVAVGKERIVRDINVMRVGARPDDFTQYREPAKAGIEHQNRRR